MKSLSSFLSGKTKFMFQASILGVLGVLGASTDAMADVPEYWNRETFNIERSTVTASLQTDDESPSRPARQVRAPRSSPANEAKVETAEPKKEKSKPVRVASLGKTYVPEEKPAAKKSVGGGGGINWIASSSCLDGSLRSVLSQVASRFGSVTVNSTCRSAGHNRRVGGASKSWHLTGDAADFRIHGNWGAASSFLRSTVGGFKHYGGGLFHIDTGPKRSW